MSSMTTIRESPYFAAKNRLLIVCVCLIAIVGIRCRRDSNRPDTHDSTITVLYESDDYILGPARDDSPKFLMFLPLVRGYGSKAKPGLAQRWEYSPDFTAWTFHLHRDMRWHDGEQVTAHDIAFCLELFEHPDVLFAQNQIHGVDVTVLDDYTLKFTWPKPTGPAGALSGWSVYYPKHLLEGFDPKNFYKWDFWTHPVGNGPYRYVRRVPQTMMELEANPDYHSGKPAIEHVILKLSTANKVVELTSGNVDAAYYILPSDIIKLRADPRFNVYHSFAFTEPQAIHWNQAHPLLAIPQVRRALSQAIDRRELLLVNNLPDETPLIGGLSPWDRSNRLYREGKLDTGLPYDPDTAKQLLESAGWFDRDGDGVRERDDQLAQFTMLTPQGRLGTLNFALLIQHQLKQVGIAMEIQTRGRTVWREAYRTANFDATIFDVPNVPQWLLDKDFFGDGTKIGYRNPAIVRLLKELTLELDTAKQDAMYARINEMLRDDMPVTFLWPYVESFAAHRRIRGLRTPDRVDLFTNIEELWLVDED